MRSSDTKTPSLLLVQVAIAVLVFTALVLVSRNAYGQKGLTEACSETARMEIYSDAWFSNETGDVNGFELALEPPSGERRKAMLYVYEGAANTEGIPLALTAAGKNVVIQGTWVEHLIEYPSKREIVQKHFVRITATMTPDLLRGDLSIEGMVKPTRISLKKVKRIWLCTQQRSQVQYFLPRTFSDSQTLERGIVKWYSENLAALEEPPLWSESGQPHQPSFRFLWLRTWDKPVSVRVDRNNDGTATLTIKVCSGTGGNDPGKLETNRTKVLDAGQFNALTSMFSAAHFWTMQTIENSAGKDGAQWILEAADGGQYHLVERWSPKDGAVRRIGLRLLALADYKVPGDKVY